RMQSVLTLLQAAKVVFMAGWRLTSANGVSADGTVIVGDGVDPLGNTQAWIARLPEDNESSDRTAPEVRSRARVSCCWGWATSPVRRCAGAAWASGWSSIAVVD